MFIEVEICKEKTRHNGGCPVDIWLWRPTLICCVPKLMAWAKIFDGLNFFNWIVKDIQQRVCQMRERERERERERMSVRQTESGITD